MKYISFSSAPIKAVYFDRYLQNWVERVYININATESLGTSNWTRASRINECVCVHIMPLLKSIYLSNRGTNFWHKKCNYRNIRFNLKEKCWLKKSLVNQKLISTSHLTRTPCSFPSFLFSSRETNTFSMVCIVSTTLWWSERMLWTSSLAWWL